MEKIKVASEIVGVLVKNNLSALEVTNVLEEARKTFLERCWHVASEKQHAKKD